MSAVLWWNNVYALPQLKLDQDLRFRHCCSGEKEESCLLVKKHTWEDAHPILLASTVVHGKSQSTTTSRVTLICKWLDWHSLHDSFLLCHLETQHSMNPGKGEGWTSWWNNILFWPHLQLFKYKVYMLQRHVFPSDHDWWNSKFILPGITVHSFQAFFTSGQSILLESYPHSCQSMTDYGKSLTFFQLAFFFFLLFTNLFQNSTASFLQGNT